ncbi:putative polygalacturonase [Lupinus albus]|uniref:Putative polygalacturonase n=1 Tax=Lupinus albus TaxID=3870 RepID=A0A6A4QQZ7_LUPAL|nr:putative polygalacturonase [Lupinus albus]
MNGGGQINGNGYVWWKSGKALSFKNCNHLRLSWIHHLNSPMGHISINKCNNITLSHLNINAPKSSPNTDGIDIGASNHIVIRNCIIATGDDCISMDNGTSNIIITNITCGPGHGISVGSLGKNGEYATVKNVYVSNCSFNGASNGLRIKTWQGGSGYVRNITFKHIKFRNTINPIIINQDYQDIMTNGIKNQTHKSGLEITGVTYRDIKGTSGSKVAINLDCSSRKGCYDIIMEDINITPVSSKSKPTASCNNAHGRATSVLPKVPCLLKKPLGFY